MSEPKRAARRVVSGVLVLFVGVAVCLTILALWVNLANSDYGARTRATLPIQSGRDGLTATLVLHKLIPDENAVEASLVLAITNGPLLDSLKARDSHPRITLQEMNQAPLWLSRV
jgi:hypothetical protein